MQTITTEVFNLNELSDSAKERARNWYRQATDSDNYWSESVIEDAKEIGKLLGIEIKNIYWSGFCHQGQGACFEGNFYAFNLKPGAVKEYAPQDAELHRIAAEFEIAAGMFPSASFSVKHRGHYQHERCTDFTVNITDNDGNEIDTQAAAEAQDALIEASKDLMRWIYRTLEKEYEYQNADEQVDESILANEYTFTEDGERFG